MQKVSILPNYHREKSRAANTALRYTNSLPENQNQGRYDVPLHLRQSIDRLGTEMGSGSKSKFRIDSKHLDEDANERHTYGHHRSYQKSRVIQYYEDISGDDSQKKDRFQPELDEELLLLGQDQTYVKADVYRRDLELLLGKSDIRRDSYESPDDYYENPYQDHHLDDSFNHRVETYHLEDLGSQVIEEKAEEEETSTVHVFTNKPITEEYSSVADADISDDDAKITDEASVSRKSINSSMVNIKRTKMFGNKSTL